MPRCLALAPVVVIVLAVAIPPARSAADPPPGAGASAPEVVRIGYFANVTHAQAVLAMDCDDFARAASPTRVEARVFNAGPSLIEALFAGEIDLGYVGPSPAINAFLQSRGEGVRVIAGAAADGVVIVAAPNSGIRSLSDLKGKRIATPQLGNTQDLSARHFVVRVLGQRDADNILPVPNAEQASMMARGQIDAAWTVEPWGARMKSEAGARIIAEEKDLWPGNTFVLTVIVASPEFAERHRDLVGRLLRVHADWTDRLATDSEKYAPMLARAIERVTGKKLSERIIADALSRVRFTVRPHVPSIQAFAQWACELGMARSVPKVDSMIDTSVLDTVRPPSDSPESARRPHPTPR